MRRDSIFYKLFQQFPSILFEQIETLAEDLLDFSVLTDLENWLQQHQPQT